SGVAYADREALTTFYRGTQLHSSDGRFHIVLHITDVEPIACNLIAVNVNLQVWLADDAISKNSSRFDGGNFLQVFFQLQAELFNGFLVRTVHLDTHRCTHTCLQDHQTRFDWLQLW